MSSYTITLDGDILRIGFNKEVSATGDRIVRDAIAQLDVLVEVGQLSGGKLIKIDGKMSLLVAYTLAHALVHLYGAIAVFDPRLSAYIVVKSNTPDYPIASRIDAATGEVKPLEDDSLPGAPSFEIRWQGNILKATLNGQVSVEGDRIVRDTHRQLQTLIDAGQLPGGKQPLLVNGRAPVTAGFAIASRVGHLYGTVAVFDPKLGERGFDRYVVVIEHGGYRVGDIIDVERELPLARPRIKVAICGFANTGKTCLHEGLKKALLQIPDVPDTYVISGCPDGEGSFYLETQRQNRELARKLKDEYKSKFTPEFVASKARDIAAIPNSLLVFDVGGQTSPENRIIMSEATHAVILANSERAEQEIEAWLGFCQELNLPVVAILHSDYHGTEDRLECESPILKGSVHHLDRTEDASSRLMVQKLAQVLVDLVLDGESICE